MYENLFNANITVGGALLTVSKIEAYQQTSSRDILETFNFFGDPALEFKVPDKVRMNSVHWLTQWNWSCGCYHGR